NGQIVRFRKRKIPTKEMATALLAKRRIEIFEGRYFERKEPSKLTVEGVWNVYKPICERDKKAWLTERGRAAHLLRHLGKRRVAGLTVADIDEYRNLRLAEVSVRGSAPTPATLDREVELLKRALNYAVTAGSLNHNPIAHARLLRKPNVRRMVVDE